MSKNYLRVLLVVVMSGLLLSCSAHKSQVPFQPYDLMTKVRSGQYVKKVDSFLVILDSSGSMNRSHSGQKKLGIAKDVLSRMNQTMPELDYTGGLRTFGQTYRPFAKRTDLVYGMTRYSTAGLEGAIETVNPAGGASPLYLAIDAAASELKPTRGETALIIVSDGEEMDEMRPVKAAKSLSAQIGDRLCIYTVHVGKNPVGKNILEQVSAAGPCGFSVGADEIASRSGMAEFVGKVFLAKPTAFRDSDGDGVTDDVDQCPNTPRGVAVDVRGCPLDSDGDGVYDYMDKCPNTPRGVRVDARGCPLDSDGDGVYDYMDKCPNTPRGVTVDAQGCPLDSDGDGVYDYLDQCPGTPGGADVDDRGCWIIAGVHFDTAMATIKPVGYPLLNKVVAILKRNPSLKLEVQGNTDNRGTAEFNQTLSEKRAKAVTDYLVGKGISRSRLYPKGYGFTRPAAPNDTAEGRAKNRRVGLWPIK